MIIKYSIVFATILLSVYSWLQLSQKAFKIAPNNDRSSDFKQSYQEIFSQSKCDILFGNRKIVNFYVPKISHVVHNTCLNTIQQYGIIGFLLWFNGILYILWLIFKNRKNITDPFIKYLIASWVWFLVIWNVKGGSYIHFTHVYMIMYYLEYYFKEKRYLPQQPVHAPAV